MCSNSPQGLNFLFWFLCIEYILLHDLTGPFLSYSEINDLTIEAAENDGRLARRPLRDKCKEIEAHQFLLLRITELIKLHNASIKVITI